MHGMGLCCVLPISAYGSFRLKADAAGRNLPPTRVPYSTPTHPAGPLGGGVAFLFNLAMQISGNLGHHILESNRYGILIRKENFL